MTESPEWAEGINEDGDARPGRLATRRDAPRVLARCANICCREKVHWKSRDRVDRDRLDNYALITRENVFFG